MDAWHPIAICNLWRIYHQHCWSMHNLETPGGTNNITQTNPYHQRHWIFFQLTFFFWIVKLTVSVVFFLSPHQPPLMKWICYHLFCGALPCQVSRLAFKVGTASSNLDFTAGVVRLWSAWRGKPTNWWYPRSIIFSCKSIVFLIIQLSTVWMND